MAQRILRSLLAAICSLAALMGIRSAWRVGLSRTYSEYVVMASLLPPEYQARSMAVADEAVKFSPSNPDAHFARGLALEGEGRMAEAEQEFALAVSLRPVDYKFWLKLGAMREDLGDESGALNAYQGAIRRAPFYAQPRWQLGNLLLRAGRADEGFTELRRAAESDPALLPALIDLAWGLTGGDAASVERVIQPQTPAWRLALARVFAKRGKAAEAVALFRTAGGVPEAERRALIQDLIAGKRFKEAAEVWASGGAAGGTPGTITDGGFEGRLSFDDFGFGWQLPRDSPALRLSLDQAEPQAGASSLRLDWSGDPPVAAPVLSQLVMVEPNARYRLRFAARTQEIVTGGLPLVVVTDAAGDSNAPPLSKSALLSQGTSPWQESSLEFSTSANMQAVRVSLQRQACPSGPCPIFGRLWLDSFILQKL